MRMLSMRKWLGYIFNLPKRGFDLFKRSAQELAQKLTDKPADAVTSRDVQRALDQVRRLTSAGVTVPENVHVGIVETAQAIKDKKALDGALVHKFYESR
jgi:hypothetical protein